MHRKNMEILRKEPCAEVQIWFCLVQKKSIVADKSLNK